MGRIHYEKILDSEIKHLSHSSQNLMDEFLEHLSLHVAEFSYDHLAMFYPFTKLFSAIYTTPTQLLPKLPGGLLNVFCPFLKCCTVMLPYASQNPSLWFALPLPPHIFDPVHENPAAFCSSLRSINSEVQ